MDEFMHETSSDPRVVVYLFLFVKKRDSGVSGDVLRSSDADLVDVNCHMSLDVT